MIRWRSWNGICDGENCGRTGGGRRSWRIFSGSWSAKDHFHHGGVAEENYRGFARMNADKKKHLTTEARRRGENRVIGSSGHRVIGSSEQVIRRKVIRTGNQNR